MREMLVPERPFLQRLCWRVSVVRPVQHLSHCVCPAVSHMYPEEVVKGPAMCPTARVGPAGAWSPGEPGY